jgi:dihydroorotase
MKNNTTILPKAFDAHVHARDLKQSDTMTVLQTFKEAAKSGVGTVCLMPNTSPSIDNIGVLNIYLQRVEDAEKATGITGYIWVALTDINHDEVIKMLHYKKVCGVKIYPLKDDGTSVTTGAVGIQKWESFEKLLKLMQEKGIDKPIAGHWEDPKFGHTVESEVSALKNLVEVAEKYPEFRYTACHLTSAKGAAVIEDAQEDSLKIMMELTPHLQVLIFFFYKDLLNTVAQVNLLRTQNLPSMRNLI